MIINCIHLTFCFADGLILRTQRWNKLTIHDKSHQAIIKTRNGEIILKMQFSLSLSKLFDKICFFNEPIRLWTYFLFVRCDEMQSTPTVFSSRHFVVNVKPIVIRSPIIIINAAFPLYYRSTVRTFVPVAPVRITLVVISTIFTDIEIIFGARCPRRCLTVWLFEWRCVTCVGTALIPFVSTVIVFKTSAATAVPTSISTIFNALSRIGPFFWGPVQIVWCVPKIISTIAAGNFSVTPLSKIFVAIDFLPIYTCKGRASIPIIPNLIFRSVWTSTSSSPSSHFRYIFLHSVDTIAEYNRQGEIIPQCKSKEDLHFVV